jgi:hypothetical protein
MQVQVCDLSACRRRTSSSPMLATITQYSILQQGVPATQVADAAGGTLLAVTKRSNHYAFCQRTFSSVSAACI